MAQVFTNRENIGVVGSLGNVINLQPSTITVGGRQLTSTVQIDADMATNGVNGLDTGALAAYKVYNIFAINNGGVGHGTPSSTATTFSGGNETRSKNITVNIFIKIN